MHVNEPTHLSQRAGRNAGEVVRQYKPAATLGWNTFRHPGKPGIAKSHIIMR